MNITEWKRGKPWGRNLTPWHLHVGGLAPVAEAHRDAVALARGATLLDLVADDRAADGARDRRRVVAAAAAELMAEHAAGDAADHGARAAGSSRGTLDVDRHDARVIAIRGVAVSRRRSSR